MKHEYLIGKIKQYQTPRIRAYEGGVNSKPEQVPAAFALLIPEIFAILSVNLDNICEPSEGLVIFGLQPASTMLTSNAPMELKRSIPSLQPDYHFCCTLDYFIVPLGELDKTHHWQKTHSIIIDFTSGKLMDSDRFLAQHCIEPITGKEFGEISQEALDIVWTIAKIKQCSQSAKQASRRALSVSVA